MGIGDFITGLLGRKPEQKIKKLLKQIDQALDDLKIRIADSIARSNGLQKDLEKLNSGADKGSSERTEPVTARCEALVASLDYEKKAESRLREIFDDLKNRRELLELSYQQSLARLRNAELNQRLASIYRDFGDDLQLNSYLKKFSEDSFKIEFTADSQLKIEMMLNKSLQNRDQ